MTRQADLMNRQTRIAVESVRVTREAADAAKASADAALEQIRAIKSTERAKLSFELDPFKWDSGRSALWMQSVPWRVKVYGESRASDIRGPVILCLGEPSTHRFRNISSLRLPEIVSATENREYGDKLTIHYEDGHGNETRQIGSGELESGN